MKTKELQERIKELEDTIWWLTWYGGINKEGVDLVIKVMKGKEHEEEKRS